MKQIARVLDAVTRLGCRSSRDVADETGLPLAVCSNYLSELAADGLIERGHVIEEDRRGAKAFFYSPREERSA